jgi:N-formylglutamate deformylase
MKRKLPVLISIPHCGYRVPEELKGRILLSTKDIFDDSDTFAGDIYNIEKHVLYFFKADIARAFIDLNRPPSEFPPENPDGVIKSRTCHDLFIHKKEMEPNQDLRNSLLKKYYEPYHRKIKKALKDPEIRLGLDCHTMDIFGPVRAIDAGKRRPMICLGNLSGKSCSQEIIDQLTGCFIRAFGLDPSEVTQNRPFQGQHITRAYGNNPAPWVQVEMSKALYMKAPYFDEKTLKIDGDFLKEWNEKFEEALSLFFNLSIL